MFLLDFLASLLGLLQFAFQLLDFDIELAFGRVFRSFDVLGGLLLGLLHVALQLLAFGFELAFSLGQCLFDLLPLALLLLELLA